MPIRLLSSTIPRILYTPFDDLEKAGIYAILSHVWTADEQQHKDLLSLHQEAVTFDDPRVNIKIRECHRLAQEHGCPAFWIDAACIDHTYKDELPEAIASMFRWYATAAICFAYLPDVPPNDIIRRPGSAFRKSIYFKRVWTLQELIAPRRVLFLAADWSVLGEKHQLADLLQEITGIDQDVLTLQRDLRDVSVARRLSWGSQRESRRVEDRAYSLMGLFGIHMPVVYGEGEKAFTRLQVQILQEVRDHTLLAWDDPAAAAPSRDLRSAPVWPFAPSPASFSGASRLIPVDFERFVEALAPLCEASHPEHWQQASVLILPFIRA